MYVNPVLRKWIGRDSTDQQHRTVLVCAAASVLMIMLVHWPAKTWCLRSCHPLLNCCLTPITERSCLSSFALWPIATYKGKSSCAVCIWLPSALNADGSYLQLSFLFSIPKLINFNKLNKENTNTQIYILHAFIISGIYWKKCAAYIKSICTKER